MKSIFSPDGPLYNLAERLGNLVLLNMLYLLFCIPIVTIGPASAALRYVTLKYATNDEDRVFAPFWHSFKQNLKQGMIIGIVRTAITLFLAYDLYYILVTWRYISNNTVYDKVILVLVALACFVYILVSRYIYPMLARYDNSTRQLIRTSLVLAVRHLPATLCMTLLTAAPIVLMMYTMTSFALVLTFYVFIGFAALAYLQDKLIVRIF